MTTTSKDKESKPEPYFRDSAPMQPKEYYRKMLSDIEEQQGQQRQGKEETT